MVVEKQSGVAHFKVRVIAIIYIAFRTMKYGDYLGLSCAMDNRNDSILSDALQQLSGKDYLLVSDISSVHVFRVVDQDGAMLPDRGVLSMPFTCQMFAGEYKR